MTTDEMKDVKTEEFNNSESNNPESNNPESNNPESNNSESNNPESKNQKLNNSESEATARKKHKRNKIIRIVAIVIGVFLIMNVIATKIIYDSIFAGYHKPADYSQEGYTEFLSMRTVNQFDCKGRKLTGYYFDNPEDGKLVVIAPGLHSVAEDYTCIAEALYENGYDIYVFDPTGCGQSEGSSNIGYSQEILDLNAALIYVEQGLTYNSLYVLGHSRGATAACAMLSAEPEKFGCNSHEIDGVIAASGFDSAMDAIIGIPERYAGPVVNLNYGNLWLYQRTLFDAALLDLSVTEILNSTEVPVLVIQGSKDKVASASKHSIYANRQKVTCDKVTYLLFEEDNFNTHTGVLYFNDQDNNKVIVNEEAMNQIVSFMK